MYQLQKLKTEKGILHAVSDVSDGNMAFSKESSEKVSANRRMFLERIGVLPATIAPMEIMHESGMVYVGKPVDTDVLDPSYQPIKADALYTDKKNIFLFLLTGDCLPIIFYSSEKHIVALAHLSRMNTLQGFSEVVLDKLVKECGVNPSEINVAIAPGIHKESYLFSGEEVRARAIPVSPYRLDLGNGIFSFDLLGYNMDILISRGVKAENIEASEIDTGNNPNFYSHYRSGKTGEFDGRMATVVGLR